MPLSNRSSTWNVASTRFDVCPQAWESVGATCAFLQGNIMELAQWLGNVCFIALHRSEVWQTNEEHFRRTASGLTIIHVKSSFDEIEGDGGRIHHRDRRSDPHDLRCKVISCGFVHWQSLP